MKKPASVVSARASSPPRRARTRENEGLKAAVDEISKKRTAAEVKRAEAEERARAAEAKVAAADDRAKAADKAREETERLLDAWLQRFEASKLGKLYAASRKAAPGWSTITQTWRQRRPYAMDIRVDHAVDINARVVDGVVGKGAAQ